MNFKAILLILTYTHYPLSHPYYRRVWDEFRGDSPCFNPYILILVTPPITGVFGMNFEAIPLVLTRTHYPLSHPITGVFGMNFEAGAGYSIPLLNDPNGPNVFISMCIGR